MKTKVLVFAVALLIVVLVGVRIFADDKEDVGFYVPKRNEEIYGTWENKNYEGKTAGEKVVYFYWGYGESYRTEKSEAPSWKFGFTIVDKWSDSAGNIWYKSYEITTNDYSVYFTLSRISKDATVLEYVDAIGEYPTAADLNAGSGMYSIRYRQ